MACISLSGHWVETFTLKTNVQKKNMNRIQSTEIKGNAVLKLKGSKFYQKYIQKRIL